MVLELQKPRPIWQIMFSTHHTDIGLLYLITSLAFMFMGGALALILRLELFAPGTQVIADSMTYNRIFTVHGTTLIFLFILPSASAFGNYLVPIMVRFKDMAFPQSLVAFKLPNDNIFDLPNFIFTASLATLFVTKLIPLLGDS